MAIGKVAAVLLAIYLVTDFVLSVVVPRLFWRDLDRDPLRDDEILLTHTSRPGVWWVVRVDGETTGDPVRIRVICRNPYRLTPDSGTVEPAASLPKYGDFLAWRSKRGQG